MRPLLPACSTAAVEARNNGYYPRVRKELRSLTDREYKCFITGERWHGL